MGTAFDGERQRRWLVGRGDLIDAGVEDGDVLALRRDRSAGMSFRQLAAKHGVGRIEAYRIAVGQRWAHLPLSPPPLVVRPGPRLRGRPADAALPLPGGLE